SLGSLPVGAPERVVLDRIPVPTRAVDLVRAHLHDGATNGNTGAEELARDRAGGDAARGLAGGRAAAAPIVANTVLGPIGVVGVARPELVLGLVVVLRARVDIL